MKKSFLLATVFLMVYFLYAWHSPMPNSHPCLDYKDCIYKDSSRKELKLTSCGSDFAINYVENSSAGCWNPTFPSIHIVAHDRCNAWLQIIYADCPVMKDWQFLPINETLCYRIDTAKKDNDPHKVYPFYTKCKELYDAPQWGFSFFQKDLTFWRAHAYAVSIDQEKKMISCIGGIVWGYRLPRFCFKPTMITPNALSLDDWKNDWKLFHTVLPDFVATDVL